MPFDLLEGVRVLEVSLLAPDALGAHLADLGAEVIKIEDPARGDHARTMGWQAIGSPEGPSPLHLHWNRGKTSVALSLKTPEGREAFVALARRSHVVIEGLRAGTLDRWGLGYATLRAANAALVYCSLSGLGRSGPYKDLATHGRFFDAYAGFIPPEERDDGTLRQSEVRGMGVGIQASALWAASAVTAALLRAARTSAGALIEVAEAEVSAHWQWFQAEPALNREKMHRRPSYPGEVSTDSVRYAYYRTKDDRVIFLQATESKFWDNLLRALGRLDLRETYPPAFEYDHQMGAEGLRHELQRIFETRTQRDWVAFFMTHNVAGGPVNATDEIVDDPHFRARDNVYVVDQLGAGRVTLMGTPIKIEGQHFTQRPAPALGAHTDDVLRDVLGMDAAAIAALRERGVIG